MNAQTAEVMKQLRENGGRRNATFELDKRKRKRLDDNPFENQL